MITLGATGYYVRAVQRVVGVPTSQVDGTWGPKTDALVKAWQAARGVVEDGFGPLSRAAVDPGDFIKAYEGLRLQAYDDHDGATLNLRGTIRERQRDGLLCIGYPTIGWGRRIWPGETLQTCTRVQADQWFAVRLAAVELPAVNRYPLDDAAQKCAAASFAYNSGIGALVKLMGRPTEENWLSYCHTKGIENAGLKMRRAEEWALFNPPL